MPVSHECAHQAFEDDSSADELVAASNQRSAKIGGGRQVGNGKSSSGMAHPFSGKRHVVADERTVQTARFTTTVSKCRKLNYHFCHASCTGVTEQMLTVRRTATAWFRFSILAVSRLAI